MAWRSSGTSNADLIANLCRNGMIKDDRVKEAFLKPPTPDLKVDRANYASSSPYNDSPQPIGHGATISAPHMHAMACEHLLDMLAPPTNKGGSSSSSSSSDSPSQPPPPPPPRRVLDIGSGSGYLTHVLAELVCGGGGGGGGTVVGVEHITALRDLGESNMRRSDGGRALLDSGRVRFRVGDGRKGWAEPGEEQAGWDAIHVGASAVELHDELVRQLRAPGRMFIPVDDGDGGGGQHIWAVEKDEKGVVAKKRLFGVRYVPLTDAPK